MSETPFGALLDALVEYVRTYMVMTAAQVTATVLWAAHTHVLDAFETTPFLGVTSPEKQCGKSRLFDVLELIVARAWRTIMPSEAVLYRKIQRDAPTLMLDEADAIFDKKNGSTEPLRALLNAGNRRGTAVPRCVGPTQQLVDFATFCPKALAGIGDYMPETVRDRSIVIRLERRRRDEAVSRFRKREAYEIAEPIRQALADWGEESLDALEAARPNVPDVLDDRAEEAWEPLLAIADMAGGAWPERARSAARTLSGDRDTSDEALGPWLLRDIRTIFGARGVDRLSSIDLLAGLTDIEESPWGDIRGRPLAPAGLARRLRRFEIRPRTVRFDDDTTAKGYHLEWFEDAFARYLAIPAVTTVTTAWLSQEQGISETSQDPFVTASESASNPHGYADVTGVTAQNAENDGEVEKNATAEHDRLTAKLALWAEQDGA